MKKIALITVLTLLTALGGVANAQAPAATAPAPAAAPAATSTDPIVQLRADERAAKAAYKQKVSAASKDRDAKVKTAVDSAVADAKAHGKDPLVAKRDAKKKAKQETKADYDAAVKAAKQERDTAIADARKKAGK